MIIEKIASLLIIFPFVLLADLLYGGDRDNFLSDAIYTIDECWFPERKFLEVLKDKKIYYPHL